ncbi:protein-tyrosine-phosphatase [Malassezia vespertilionis]|uniref:protein-tyrosine-phosphatase n=1 Tax=Malassezia vespertilionis TaxID=2020962 RepID=UPI0024B09FA4|nr:protein-tyrosine-phosphatase [Malassezia vespertilionis]WFD05865.1 protein-tyrosine-phosphatase [Malassezia vespertilionis]
MHDAPLAAQDDAALMPKVVVFDLDYTLWPYWVDTHIDPPLKRKHDQLNQVVDRSGQKLSFFQHVPSILFELKARNVCIAAASRTSAPTVARQALRELALDRAQSSSSRGPRQSAPPIISRDIVKAIHLFDQLEIYPGSKITHFNKIAQTTGVAFKDMLFFDDERRNAEVQRKLGVHFVHVGSEGLDLA